MPERFDYLATPYTKYPLGMYLAFEHAAELASRLIRNGMIIYSPIAHTHPIAHYGQMDLADLAIWLPFNRAMMLASHRLIVAHMVGWERSVGIAYEVSQFLEWNKPILDLDPETLEMTPR